MLAVYQTHFLEAALAADALKFGEFTLKSGRHSPYFFNAAAFCNGKLLSVMTEAYAAVIAELHETCAIDVLFGPAYKGIPLVAGIAQALFHRYDINLAWAFNRKETKTHGEGGNIVGASVAGKKVLLVDDVLTAGTAVRQSLALLAQEQAMPVGLVIALDRQEKVGDSNLSALKQFSVENQLQTRAIITLDDLMTFVKESGKPAVLEKMQAYRKIYGISEAD